MQRPKTIPCQRCWLPVPVKLVGALPRCCGLCRKAKAAAFAARKRAQDRAAGVCMGTGCSKRATAGVFCPKHRKANCANVNGYREARVAAGLCWDFGCTNLAEPGRRRCAECAKAKAAYEARRRRAA